MRRLTIEITTLGGAKYGHTWSSNPYISVIERIENKKGGFTEKATGEELEPGFYEAEIDTFRSRTTTSPSVTIVEHCGKIILSPTKYAYINVIAAIIPNGNS